MVGDASWTFSVAVCVFSGALMPRTDERGLLELLLWEVDVPSSVASREALSDACETTSRNTAA